MPGCLAWRCQHWRSNFLYSSALGTNGKLSAMAMGSVMMLTCNESIQRFDTVHQPFFRQGRQGAINRGRRLDAGCVKLIENRISCQRLATALEQRQNLPIMAFVLQAVFRLFHRHHLTAVCPFAARRIDICNNITYSIIIITLS